MKFPKHWLWEVMLVPGSTRSIAESQFSVRMNWPNMCTRNILLLPPHLCYLAQLWYAEFSWKLRCIENICHFFICFLFCFANNLACACKPDDTVSLWFQCTVRPVSGALGVHAWRKEKHVASKEALKHGSAKSYSILQPRAICVPQPARQGRV